MSGARNAGELDGLSRREASSRRKSAAAVNASTTFYRWYDRYRASGEAGPEDRTSGPSRVWNRLPDDVRQEIAELALDEPELSPREQVNFTEAVAYSLETGISSMSEEPFDRAVN
jgi:transposase